MRRLVHDLVNANMASAIHVVTVQRGLDPRDHVPVAFGGAGPMHMIGVAERFGIEAVVAPDGAGVTSAIGMLGSDLADSVRAAAREAWPTGGPRRNRLFAFGFDAYRLTAALRAGSAVNVDGLTGRLTIDADRRVLRELAWAQLHNGVTRPIPVTAAAATTTP